jgi:hypothetical protein
LGLLSPHPPDDTNSAGESTDRAHRLDVDRKLTLPLRGSHAEVIRVTHEPVATAFKLAIQFVQNEIREQWRERTALWRPFEAFLEDPAVERACRKEGGARQVTRVRDAPNAPLSPAQDRRRPSQWSARPLPAGA